MTTQNIVMHC